MAAELSARLDEIGTDWEIVFDPGQFVLRYAAPVQRYMLSLLRNVHDAEEASQDFFLRVVRHGFVHVKKEGGRFRDYLRVAARNAALNYVRQATNCRTSETAFLLSEAKPGKTLQSDQEWLAEWRRCLLDRAIRGLSRHQSQIPGNLFHTVMSLIAEHPLDDCQTLTERVVALTGQPLSVEAFRKQVSRARRMLARLLVDEISRTIESATPDCVREELVELGLWEYVQGYLSSPLEQSPSKASAVRS